MRRGRQPAQPCRGLRLSAICPPSPPCSTQALEAESGYKEKYEKLLEPMVEWRKIFGSKVAELDDLHSALGELLTD